MAGRPAITSARSTRVVAARRLATRAFRTKQGLFLAEGPQAVREAAAHPGGIAELYFSAAASDRHPEIIEAAYAAGADLLPATDEVIASLSDTVHPQGMVAVCHRLDTTLSDALSPSARLVVLLAHVRDPGNVGSVIRAADAAGADAVLVSDESVDVYNPKAVRSSAGSLFHLPIVVGVTLGAALERCRAAGLRILAADGTGPLDLDDEADSGALRAPSCWIFGNEAWGLPDAIRDQADVVVRVPIHGKAESLNLSTAAAVCLYASARAQRRTGGSPQP
ncbi:MAG TPA: RNA methyltransferase [Actinocrinis sp.]|uniref:TrmH family RNA methyltransferase n=1 Tax=Actinocrinis sp. TaxID=1920516 RepID=UPI002DDD89B9|nr:RNA methyltransferase [Actinocrinis sp.]HEV2345144.1 RNA methyltransferase [Actinocrinis sp.]